MIIVSESVGRLNKGIVSGHKSHEERVSSKPPKTVAPVLCLAIISPSLSTPAMTDVKNVENRWAVLFKGDVPHCLSGGNK